MSQSQAAEAYEGAHKKTGWEAASYTSETSTKLSSRTASTDLGFKHRKADKMMLSAQVKLPKSTCSRQRWHRRVRASSKCPASTTRASADQKQECVYQLLCVISKDVANIIMPLYVITGSDHTSVWLLRPWQKDTAATGAHWIRGNRAPRTGRWKSGVTKRSQSWYESIRPVQSLYMPTWERMCYLWAGQGFKMAKKWRKIAQSATPLMTSYWIIICKRTNDITYWLIYYDLSFYWPWLGIHEW